MSTAKRVLLVDDSTMSAKQLEKVVTELSGYEVIGHAKNGAEALRMFNELGPDIVCMDIVMPLMDGLQALRSLLQINPDAKVVMISSIGGARDKVVEALRLGAKTVIAKPFEADNIRKAFQSL